MMMNSTKGLDNYHMEVCGLMVMLYEAKLVIVNAKFYVTIIYAPVYVYKSIIERLII